MEAWRSIYGYTGLYSVSDRGRVRNDRTGKVLAPRGNLARSQQQVGVNLASYLQVALYRKGKRKNRYVHRLVMRAFAGPCPARHDVEHRDRDPQNNRRTNLVYLEAKRNQGRHVGDCPCCWCREAGIDDDGGDLLASLYSDAPDLTELEDAPF